MNLKNEKLFINVTWESIWKQKCSKFQSWEKESNIAVNILIFFIKKYKLLVYF